MVKCAKTLCLWALSGGLYYLLELLWRGYSHPSMFVLGGICGICIGTLSQMPAFNRLQMISQAAIGVVIVLTAEFLSGCILNLWLGWNIWDYSRQWGNIKGQICPLYAVLWFLMMPCALWLEDTLRWKLWREGRPYSLLLVYRDCLRRKSHPQPAASLREEKEIA